MSSHSQDDVLEFMYENKDVLPLGSGKLYQAYVDITDYSASHPTFSELLSKLVDRGLIEKAGYGSYKLEEEHGTNYVENMKGMKDSEVIRADDYGDVIEELQNFLTYEADKEIAEARIHGRPVKISLQSLDRFNTSIIDFFESHPDDFQAAVQEALDNHPQAEDMTYCLKPDLEHFERNIHDSKTSDYVGKPVIMKGFVRKNSGVSPLVISAIFECSQCGDRYEKEQESTDLKSPYKCDCGSRKFDVVRKNYTDVIDLQLAAFNETGSRMSARLTGSLGEETQKDLITGTNLKVLAVIRESPVDKDSRKMDTYLDIIDYTHTDKKQDISEIDQEVKDKVRKKVQESEDPFDELVIPSVAPGIKGVDLGKKVTAVSYWGSPQIELPGTGRTDYGRIHSALIANPGVGKSGILDWWKANISNTFQAQGKSSTSAGLTATVEQTEGNEWQLVAGKLVFADKGFLQIDEFDKFQEGELSALNTAMEKGFFDVDKATVNGQDIPGRATVIAGGNFQEEPDEYTAPYELLPDKEQGLYDRFALIAAMEDPGDEAVDAVKNRFMPGDSTYETPLSIEELRVYRHISRECRPDMSDEAWSVLKSFIEAAGNLSSSSSRSKSMRPIVQLGKITLAMARFNLRKDVAREEDARKACKLIRESRESLGLSMEDDSIKNELMESQRMKKVKELAEKVSDQDGEVDVQELKEEVVNQTDIASKTFEKILEKLKNNGEFFEPRSGTVKAL